MNYSVKFIKEKTITLKRVKSKVSKMFFRYVHFPKILTTFPQSKWPPRPEAETITDYLSLEIIWTNLRLNRQISQKYNIAFIFTFGACPCLVDIEKTKVSSNPFEPEFNTNER